MVSPNELKNKEFSKSLRGYCTEEVNEHIDFIIKKYSELCCENDELTKRLRLTEAQLETMKSEEDSIRSALINAQKAANKIIKEADEKANSIILSAKEECDRLISELKSNVEKENHKIKVAKDEVSKFKAHILSEYADHTKKLDNILQDKVSDTNEMSDKNEVSSINEENIDELVSLLKKNIDMQLEADIEVEAQADEDDEYLSEDSETEINNCNGEQSENSCDIQESEQEYISPSESTIVFERTVLGNSGESIVDSVKALNKSISDNFEDDDFIAMIQKKGK